MKTIKQIADELGVSKTAIRKKMTEEFRDKYVETAENGVLLVSDEGQKLLESLRKPVETTENQLPETTENQLPPNEIEWYREQIDKKDALIDELRAENKKLTDELLKLSSKTGDALDALSKSQLAEKMIEGQQLLEDKKTKKKRFGWFRKEEK